ncbi:hypothetical protein ACFFX0_12450 [Citricoccus parietis]|uniref:Uncharacterized protein n=1 Tax=Citricoccus parietis TaxID=592307 RepID=A0ABV5FZ60_9MICC
MPALPGAAWTSWTSGSSCRARMMACSRPPEPRTRIFTVPKPRPSGPSRRACVRPARPHRSVRWAP